MGIIQRLEQHEIQKIAAGEVVERPANVVKELVENSLDAGATSVAITIIDGGKKLIQINDNGKGMDAEDALLCFEHHTTSKLTSVSDLPQLQTFGFRGEALSSITAVSNSTITTKQATTELGTKVTIQAGTCIKTESVTAPNGTEIRIEDLLFNVPARRKFLRANDTESRQITTIFHAFCLAYPQVHFTLTNNGHVTNCPGTGSLQNRIAQLWPTPDAPRMHTLEEHPTVSGVISHYLYGRYDRSWMFFFVNGRWVKNYTLARAVMNGYANVLQQGRYPVACINVSVPSHEIDINVHPRKEELLFAHPKRVEQAISDTVRMTLEREISLKLNASSKSQMSRYSTDAVAPSLLNASPWQENSSGDLITDNSELLRHGNGNARFSSISSGRDSEIDSELYDEIVTAGISQRVESAAGLPTFHDSATSPRQGISTRSAERTTAATPDEHNLGIGAHTQSDSPSFQLIGQLHKTYLLLEHEDGLLMVDQHAAHERILYERFDSKFAEIASTQLLFPEIVQVSSSDCDTLLPFLPLLKEHGFDVAQVGPAQLAVTATPVLSKQVNLKELFLFLAGTLTSIKALDSATIYRVVSEKLRAQMACKAAVKAGDVLDHQQMTQLLEDLHKTPNRFSCPHGRPTSWLISKYEIEKRFKRIG